MQKSRTQDSSFSIFFFKLQKPYDLFLERPLTLSVAWTSVLYAAVWLSKRLLQLDKAISWWTEDYTVKIFSLLIGKRLERYHSLFQPAIHNWGFLNMLMSLSFHSWIIFLYFQKKYMLVWTITGGGKKSHSCDEDSQGWRTDMGHCGELNYSRPWPNYPGWILVPWNVLVVEFYVWPNIQWLSKHLKCLLDKSLPSINLEAKMASETCNRFHTLIETC